MQRSSRACGPGSAHPSHSYSSMSNWPTCAMYVLDGKCYAKLARFTWFKLAYTCYSGVCCCINLVHVWPVVSLDRHMLCSSGLALVRESFADICAVLLQVYRLMGAPVRYPLPLLLLHHLHQMLVVLPLQLVAALVNPQQLAALGQRQVKQATLSAVLCAQLSYCCLCSHTSLLAWVLSCRNVREHLQLHVGLAGS